MNYIKLKLFKIKQVKESLNYKLALLKIINIFLIFYIFLFKKTLLKVLLILIIKIKFVNLNIKYKIKKILNYKLVKETIKYFIK